MSCFLILNLTQMKNLSVLLTLKQEKHSHVMLADNGTYSGMTTGSKGIVKVTDEAIAYELFGEYPLSEKNAANFRLLSKMKLPKVKLLKQEERVPKIASLVDDAKSKVAKAV
jgi:hypothetical protein